jgi:uncharacterized protein CbrC (UPF0167 family)
MYRYQRIKPEAELGMAGDICRDSRRRRQPRPRDLSVISRGSDHRIEFSCCDCETRTIYRFQGTESAARERYREQLCDSCLAITQSPAAEQPERTETDGSDPIQ